MNPIYQMVSQQLATKNPMMATMIKNLSSGMTPKQMVMNLMKNNNNPMLSQLVDMADNAAQTQTLISSLLPRPVPAYPSASPYMAYNWSNYFNNGGCPYNNI